MEKPRFTFNEFSVFSVNIDENSDSSWTPELANESMQAMYNNLYLDAKDLEWVRKIPRLKLGFIYMMVTTMGKGRPVPKKRFVSDIYHDEEYVHSRLSEQFARIKTYEVLSETDTLLKYQVEGKVRIVEGSRRERWYKMVLDEVRHHVQYRGRIVLSAPRLLAEILIEYYSGTQRTHIMETHYEQTDKHYIAISERLPILVDVVSKFDRSLVIMAPGDGIGVVAIASILMGRSFYSAEPNEIGSMAWYAGITSAQTFEEMSLESEDPVAWVYSNIQLYISRVLIRPQDQAFVLDARMGEYSEYGLVPVQGTNNRAWTNVGVVVALKPLMPPRSNHILRGEVNPLDNMAREVCRMQRLNISETGTPVVWSNREQFPAEAYILRERKFASARTGKPGQTCYDGHNARPFNEHDYLIRTETGVRVVADTAYKRAGVLPGDFGAVEFVTVETPRHPDTYKVCYVNGQPHEVLVVQVLEILDKAYRAIYQIVYKSKEYKSGSKLAGVEMRQYASVFGASGVG